MRHRTTDSVTSELIRYVRRLGVRDPTRVLLVAAARLALRSQRLSGYLEKAWAARLVALRIEEDEP
jgi:hypothetical protein